LNWACEQSLLGRAFGNFNVDGDTSYTLSGILVLREVCFLTDYFNR